MDPEDRDWIDRAISRDGPWTPPAHFVEQVALQGLQQLPAGQVRRGRVHAGVMTRVRELLTGTRQDLSLRIQGSLWILRQYRELLLH